MNFDLSPDQQMFEEAATRFAAAVDVPARHKLRGAAEGYDRSRWQEAAALGLLALPVAEEGGGLGGSLVDLVVVAQALGRANAADPWLEDAALPLPLLAGAGGEVAEQALTGEVIAALASAEPDGRYRLEPRSTQLERQGDRLVLTGSKTFVLGGALADVLLVTARLEGDLRLVVVRADAIGVERRPYRIIDGSMAAEITFGGVTLPADALLKTTGEQFEAAIATTRLLAAAEMTGLASRLLDDTLCYVREREQFGVPIGSFQAVQHRLVDCYAMLEQCRSMVWSAALAEREDDWQRQVAGAKAFVAARAEHIGREAIQLHGGMGVTDELAVGHAVKRVVLLARLFGDVDSDLQTYAMAA